MAKPVSQPVNAVNGSSFQVDDPEPWITRFAPEIAPGGAVLDLACGRGRHTAFFLTREHPVTAVDIDLGKLDLSLASRQLETVESDIEHRPWPLSGRRFAAVVVVNYLWRPVLPDIIAAVEPGGLLLYSTFAQGQERFGKPANPDYLLQPDELLDAVRGKLTVRAYEHGVTISKAGRSAMRQQLCAWRP